MSPRKRTNLLKPKAMSEFPKSGVGEDVHLNFSSPVFLIFDSFIKTAVGLFRKVTAVILPRWELAFCPISW
jgi:hypothetical protein